MTKKRQPTPADVARGRRFEEARLDYERTVPRPLRGQAAVGRAVGMSGVNISDYERGFVMPPLDRVVTLALLYGVHPGWLAFGWEPRVGTPPEALGELAAAGDEAP